MSKITNREIVELFSELSAIDKEMANLEQKKAYIRSVLATAIPGGGSKAGVSHTIRLGTSVSWAQAAKDIMDQLVPKTKAAEAKAIVEANTKQTVAHLFKMAS